MTDPNDQRDLYDTAYVRELFDAMSDSYERVNELTSFGFSRRWRRQAVAWLAPEPGHVVLDAMCGVGEGWRHLGPRLGRGGRIVALDLSPGMVRHAARRAAGDAGTEVDLRVQDVLDSGLGDASVDGVLCLFGIKTLSVEQRKAFAQETARVLRHGGRFSFIEVSMPSTRLLRWPYMTYLRHVIPVLGRLLLGGPESYRMLAEYTARFGDARGMAEALRGVGLEAELTSAFFGCATGIAGHRP